MISKEIAKCRPVPTTEGTICCVIDEQNASYFRPCPVHELVPFSALDSGQSAPLSPTLESPLRGLTLKPTTFSKLSFGTL